MLNISIKEAAIGDADEYVELEKKVGGRTYFGLTKNEFIEEFTTRKIYLFKLGDKTIGHLSLKIDEKGAHLGGFAVEPEYQGKGYGREGLRLVLEAVKDVPRIDLVTHPENSKSIHLYQSYGFEIVERRENYWGDGEPRVVLVKNQK
ncbi:MAG: GNAT family N-acetyltransferase [Candidatus Pacebacteria bacterium]|jgi:ribosomal protein S18 acetylase RimI-like enzyme|nr:GNAT family N-acetyltransferase [Candidatus Paceibacterota bacterium]